MSQDYISGGVMGKKRSTLLLSEEQNERDEVKSCHQTKARDREKGTVSLCHLKSVLLGAAFCQERWLSREA